MKKPLLPNAASMLSKTDGAAPFLQIAQRSIKKPDNLQSVANHPVFRMHDNRLQ